MLFENAFDWITVQASAQLIITVSIVQTRSLFAQVSVKNANSQILVTHVQSNTSFNLSAFLNAQVWISQPFLDQ